MQSLHLSDEELLQAAETALSQVLAYWASLDDRPAFPTTSGEQTTELFSRQWAEDGLGHEVLKDFDVVSKYARPSGGRFFGYVFGSGEPIGALGDLFASALNQNVTAWRSAPAATAIEKTVVGWLAEAVGCTGFHGSLCGGGSAANLMAIAMAREAKSPANETGARPCVVYASEEVHMSIPKAIALLGIGRDHLRLIPVDGSSRIRVDALADAITEDKNSGKNPVAIVANAGTVATGAVDPLDDVGEIANREGLWLHADGAYGGLAALAEPRLFSGIDLADSISLDAHKWFYQPVDCGCLLYRDPSVARATFSDSGDYVKTFTEDPVESFAFFEESAELSRRFRAMKLWMSLQYHGRRAFRVAISRDLMHARMLANEITSHEALELLASVRLSAVCFRHRHVDNEALLRRIISRGRVYLSNATIKDRFALRACFVNHRTMESDVHMIISEVLAAADEINR